MIRYIGLDGKVVLQEEAVLSAADHGVMFGIGLFETFRTYNGSPFALTAHGRRLDAACRELQIEHRFDERFVRDWIARLLNANGLADAVFRYTVTAGESPGGLPRDAYASPRILMYVRPLPLDGFARSGRPLQLLRTRRNTPEGGVRFKSAHYMNNILAYRELAAYSWAADAEGLQLSESGAVAEGIVSNVFFLGADDTWRTPGLEHGILPGITRDRLLREMRRRGDAVEEGTYTWEDLREAKEIFLTNSVQEIVPVTVLLTVTGERQTVGDGKPGCGTRNWQRLYAEWTAAETGKGVH